VTDEVVALEGQTPSPVTRGKLAGWVALVSVLAGLAYVANVADSGDPDRDLLYQWASAVGGAVQYGVILGVVLLIARGLDRRTLGLQPPGSWGRALGLGAVALVTIWIVGGVLNTVLQAGEEQGLVPDGWDSSRAAPFVANFVVVAMVAPVVEELTFRGLGYATVGSVLSPVWTVLVTGLAFGLAHGLVVALPILSLFGVLLGWLRWKTDSLYPPIALHAVFNAAALIAAVTLGDSV
jgi:membrane protease YdiL (CAAX protease family)